MPGALDRDTAIHRQRRHTDQRDLASGHRVQFDDGDREHAPACPPADPLEVARETDEDDRNQQHRRERQEDPAHDGQARHREYEHRHTDHNDEPQRTKPSS